MSTISIPAPALPPTPRDFDIHKMYLVQHTSTRTIAEKHGISQTRVRQVIQRVTTWLAAALPVKTEAEQEQETHLAKHLAADQFRHQLEELRCLWDGTHDPKYLRQQTRVITALARLGILPGAIDSLAADATAGPLDPNEPQPPWSEDDPWSNRASYSEISNPKSEIASAPPSEDCSPSAPPTSAPSPASEDPAAATDSPSQISERQTKVEKADPEALNILEQRLLTLLEKTEPDDAERRESLSRTLHTIRGEKALLELRLSPHSTPSIVPIAAPPPTQPGNSPSPVPDACANP